MTRTKTRPINLLCVVLILLLLSLLGADTAAASRIPDPRFGVVEAHEAPAEASALGAGWTRVRFEWNGIQPTGSHEWEMPISDGALGGELAAGREVVGLLVTTPGWATDYGLGAGVPRGLYLPPEDPNNLWAGFVRRIVGQYAGRVDHWTLGNEPDIPPGSPDMSWGGTVDDFVRFLQVGYTAAKEANPGAVIHMAAITHHHDEHWFGRFLNALVDQPGAAQHGYYFDVATLHLFHEPEKIYDITAHYYGMMRGHAIHKPVWIAETNAYLSRATPEEQAFFLVQALSLEIAAGAQRIAVYKMADTATDAAADPEPFGLVRMDGSRRPAFTAYQAATAHLAGFRGASWDRRDTISVVTVDRGARTTTVVWSRVPEAQTATVPARGTRALLVDVWGSAHFVYPERGYYYVDLPGARCPQGCQIGGAPYMVVEEAPIHAETAPTPSSPTPTATEAVEATSEPAAEPSEATSTAPPTSLPPATTTSTPTRTASPTRTFTSPPTATATPRPSATPTPTPSPAPTLTPSPTATLVPTSEPTTTSVPTATPALGPPTGAGIRSWILIGVLVVGLQGVALAANGNRR